jgi:hypothetical protein
MSFLQQLQLLRSKVNHIAIFSYKYDTTVIIPDSLCLTTCTATLIAGIRPLLPSLDYPAYQFERQLYLILRDEQIRAADPQCLLERALDNAEVHRLQAAKVLTADSPVLKSVPRAARDRFIELLNATPSEAGMQRQ